MKRPSPTSVQPEAKRIMATNANDITAPATRPQQYEDGREATNDEAVEPTLHQLAPEGRQQLYLKHFGHQVEPIQYLCAPECDNYPEFMQEIITAYLRHTTFAFKIYVNYDTIVKKFYAGDRASCSGKIVLDHTDKRHFRNFKPETLELGRVRLGIGTPFEPLAYINIRFEASAKLRLNGELTATIKSFPEIHKHPSLASFLDLVCEDINDIGVPSCQEGLQIRDIEEIAQLFRREPTPKEQWQRERYKDCPGDAPDSCEWEWEDRLAGNNEIRVKPLRNALFR